MVLFYFDLADDGSLAATNMPDHLNVARKTGLDAIDTPDWQQITELWNPRLCRRNFSERFQEGASLWLIRSEGRLAGYGWTMTGRTIAPHYHPLGANDVHLFDFLVFPEFRGRNINPSLVRHILNELTAEGSSRAFIEVREWNRPQMISLAKTPFRCLGVARKASLFGKTFVEWSAAPGGSVSQTVQSPAQDGKTANRVSMISR
jgi:ribosomal protein S18 acetylase RimI-like enzyme